MLEKESYFCLHEMLQTLHAFKQGFEILQGYPWCKEHILCHPCENLPKFGHSEDLSNSSLHTFSKNLLRVWQFFFFFFFNIKYFLSLLIIHSMGQVGLAGSSWHCKHWAPPCTALTHQKPTKPGPASPTFPGFHCSVAGLGATQRWKPETH